MTTEGLDYEPGEWVKTPDGEGTVLHCSTFWVWVSFANEPDLAHRYPARLVRAPEDE